MITSAVRSGLEESIRTCWKSLFLTSAIPDLVSQDGTPKQVEYLAATLQKEVDRREENKRGLVAQEQKAPRWLGGAQPLHFLPSVFELAAFFPKAGLWKDVLTCACD